MTKVLAVHSHRGGTGKSHVAANLAAVMARDGQKVCLVDTDVQSPGLNVLFGIPAAEIHCALGDYLLGECEIRDTIIDVTDRIGDPVTGELTLVPSRPDSAVIGRIVGTGYDAGLLDEGLRLLIDTQQPDVLILDTHSGLTNETLVALALADAMTVVIRPDAQEYQGSGVTVAVTRRLNCPATVLVLNMVSASTDPEAVKQTAARAYGCEVTAVLPYSTEVASLGSSDLMVTRHPDHELMTTYESIVKRLLAAP